LKKRLRPETRKDEWEKKIFKKQFTVRFWCQGIAKIFFRMFETSFDTKMMVKSGVIEIIFKSLEPFQSYLLTGQSDSATE
jgi:hypothetical protein